MPYSPECPCPICSEACIYISEGNRSNYVHARENGASMNEAQLYTAAISHTNSDARPFLVWQEENRPTLNAMSTISAERFEDYEPEDYEPEDEIEHYGREDERSLSADLRALVPTPLVRILNRGGRIWSAEVEINGLTRDGAASALGVMTDGYGAKSQQDCNIVATHDCTVDAEIKLGRMRDGAAGHGRAAASAYDILRRNGAVCGFNTGHHVHVDATRIVDLGVDAVDRVIEASLTLAEACSPTLDALAASGYPYHRGEEYAGSLKEGLSAAQRSRSAWHGSNARYCAQEGGMVWGSIPTFEYRLPNGTVWAERAHAHVGIACGLLDFGERVLDRDPSALEILRQCRDRISHAADYSQADGAAVITRALDLHPHTLRALYAAAETAPMSTQTVQAFKIAAGL